MGSQRRSWSLAATALCLAALSAPAATLDRAEGDPDTHAATANVVLASSIQVTGEQLLLKAREASSRMFNEVENVICREDVARFKAGRSGHQRQVDVIQTQVTVENGTERYSSVLQNKRKRGQMSEVGGAWSEGEYATFLHEARRVLASDHFIRSAYLARLNGAPAVIFPFEMNETESAWDFQVGSHHYALPFHGELWVSSETGELLRIKRLATQLDPATGVAEVEWTVDFSPVSMNGRTLSLPSKALYSVTYLNDQGREWNAISFSAYQRFTADAVIQYNLPPSADENAGDALAPQ